MIIQCCYLDAVGAGLTAGLIGSCKVLHTDSAQIAVLGRRCNLCGVNNILCGYRFSILPFCILIQMVRDLILSLIGLPALCKTRPKGTISVDDHQTVKHQLDHVIRTCVGGVHRHEGIPVTGLCHGNDFLTACASCLCSRAGLCGATCCCAGLICATGTAACGKEHCSCQRCSYHF